MSERGFYLVSRGMLDHPRFKPRGPFTQFEAWHWLIESAAYTSHEVPVSNGRNRQMVQLEPGQLTYSIRYLAEAWQWSDKRVQRFLSALQLDQSVTTQTNTGQTVITLCNWEKYQRPDFEATTQTATATTTATTTNKKERKESKNISPSGSGEPEGFEPWYAAYPKHVDRLEAAKAFARLMKSGRITLEALMAATARYAGKVANTEKQFIKAPSVWINKGSYLDEPDVSGEPAAVPIDPLSFDDDGWRRRLKYFHDAEKWLEVWGPKPGAPGCLVPSHLILTPVSDSKGAA